MTKKYNFLIDKHEISCRSINSVINYVRYRGKDVHTLLEGLGYDEEYLTDTNNWISQEVANDISARLRALFDDDEIMYKVGLSAEKLHTLGFLDYVVRLMGNPQFILKHAPVLNKYFTKTDEIEVLSNEPSGAVIKYYAKPGYQMTADDCYYTKGIFTALPSIWKADPAKLREETCSVPIDKKGRINGKYYTVDDKGYVNEHDTADRASVNAMPKMIGKLNPDGTFTLNGTTYGASCCLYHVSWSTRRMWLKRIFYDIVTKPQLLVSTIEEMQKENDIIQQKYEELYQKNIELQRHYVDTINAFIHALDAKDHYTEDHSLKVTRIAASVATELGLSIDDIEVIKDACKLHDIGKIGIKDSILLKPGKLSEEEWCEIKKHPILGAEIIKPLTFLSDIAVLILQDHERWDGKGYPAGLKGEEIAIGARIIAIADAYDAMTSGRIYKKPISKKEAIEELRRNAGTQFDPKVVDTFIKVLGNE